MIRLYVNDDLTSREREMQKTIRETAQEILEDPSREVKVAYRKMRVDGTEYVWSEKTKLFRKEKGGKREEEGE